VVWWGGSKVPYAAKSVIPPGDQTRFRGPAFAHHGGLLEAADVQQDLLQIGEVTYAGPWEKNGGP
jgi:hypothetical protein